METILVILVIAVVIVVFAVVSTLKDRKAVASLEKHLQAKGHYISVKTDVPDIHNDTKPFCFLLDRPNKKWFLAGYRAQSAIAYDYTDLVNYSISIRGQGTDIEKGALRQLDARSHIGFIETGILKELNLAKENCEYIALTLEYQGAAKRDSVCNSLVLFEKQESGATKNNDFLFPSVCISNAAEFEGYLYEIICNNNGVK